MATNQGNKRKRSSRCRLSARYQKPTNNKKRKQSITKDANNNNKKISNTKITQQNIIVSAYYHSAINDENKNKYIPIDVINVIIEFLYSLCLYLQISCNKTPHSNLGRIYKMDYDEINIDYFIKKNAFNLLCKNCGNKNCLKFMQSYKENIDQYIGSKNNANEYQCLLCQYFNVFNVKINVLKYEIAPKMIIINRDSNTRNTSQDIFIQYVTPFRFETNRYKHFKYGVLSSNIKKPKYCPICYTFPIQIIGSNQEDTHCMQIFGLFKNQTNVKRNIFYCIVCDLYIHNIIENNSSVSHIQK